MAKEKQVKIPNKTTMNLYQVDNKGNNIGSFALGLVIIVIVSFLIAQFAVIGRLNKLNKLQNEVNQVQSSYNAYEEEMKEYPTVKENYLRYSDDFSNDSIVYLDRITVMNMLEKACDKLGSIVSYSVSRNDVILRVNTKTLDDFNSIKSRLDNDKHVTNVTPVSSDDDSIKGIVVNILRISVKEVEE